MGHFHPYLYRQAFTIWTDQASLQWLTNFKQHEGQLSWWLEQLSQYDFWIQHRVERLHGNETWLHGASR